MVVRTNLGTMSGMVLNRLQPKFAANSEDQSNAMLQRQLPTKLRITVATVYTQWQQMRTHLGKMRPISAICTKSG